MTRWFLSLSLLAIGVLAWRLATGTKATDRPSVATDRSPVATIRSPVVAEPSAAERGRHALEAWQMSPGIWSLKAYDTVWKIWGLKEKPANFAQLFRERYGLHEASYENHGRPIGLSQVPGPLGQSLVQNCLLCHVGSIAGKTIMGLGNSTLDLEALYEELSLADGVRLPIPEIVPRMSYVRGTTDPVNQVIYMLEYRDHELNVKPRVKWTHADNVCSDPFAWWLMKRKKTRDWTGGIDARIIRMDMVNLLTPLNSPDYIKSQEKVFADIRAFIHSIESPKYPFAIDKALAKRGHGLYTNHCAKCHGTYGANPTYPDKIVPLEKIGTDPILARAINLPEMTEFLNKSWFCRDPDHEGNVYRAVQNNGYQAPPLDGVWATASYFHNSSVPTVYHVLNSKSRPRIYTRTYRTGVEDYDKVKLGWKITELDKHASPDLPDIEKRKIYDTTLPGRGNAGHRYGDNLTEEERMAVIEYLKTL